MARLIAEPPIGEVSVRAVVLWPTFAGFFLADTVPTIPPLVAVAVVGVVSGSIGSLGLVVLAER